jgi:hypothetical protein
MLTVLNDPVPIIAAQIHKIAIKPPASPSTPSKRLILLLIKINHRINKLRKRKFDN